MEKKYICPDCGGEMAFGYLLPGAMQNGLSAIWAPEAVCDDVNLAGFPKGRLMDKGGINVPLNRGIVFERTPGFACSKCGNILIKASKQK